RPLGGQVQQAGGHNQPGLVLGDADDAWWRRADCGLWPAARRSAAGLSGFAGRAPEAGLEWCREARAAAPQREQPMPMFTHVAVGTNDLAKARAFYDAVLAPLGYKRLKDLGDRGSCWGQSREEFIVLTPADGKPATSANGGTVSFAAPTRAAVAAFHR